MNNSISSITRFEVGITPAAGVAAHTDINGAIIDLANALGVAFLVRFGVIVATAVTSIKVQHGDAADLSDAADIEGSAQTVAATDDGKLFVADVRNPTKRYARVVVLRATEDSTVQAEALVYGVRSAPITQPALTKVEAFGSPISGTA